jgi:hypothetical protein
VLAGVDLLMRRDFLFFIFLFFLSSSIVFAQSGEQKGEPNIFAIVKDAQGSILEGYLRAQPEEVTVFSKDNQEKKIPSKYIKSITLEKIKAEGPLADPKQEARYSVRLQNSQEIYTLREKYTFSLNTRIGVVTRTIDPDVIHDLFSKDASETQTIKSDRDEPFIQDKSIVFSLELKF